MECRVHLENIDVDLYLTVVAQDLSGCDGIPVPGQIHKQYRSRAGSNPQTVIKDAEVEFTQTNQAGIKDNQKQLVRQTSLI